MLKAIFVVAALSSSALAQQCTQWRERKEIHDMTKAEVQAFVAAMKKLHNTGMSPYEQRAFDHNQYAPVNHGTSFFLPYHRALLLDVENALRAANPDNPTITIPYWNWTINSQDPWNDWILAPDVLGDSNRNNCNANGCCITETPGPGINGWIRSPRLNDCIRRKFTYGQQLDQGTMHVWARITDVINTSADFQTFSRNLEVIHGTPHTWVGGTMSTMWSMIDPLFIIHHAFIDSIWDLQQRQRDPTFKSFGPNSINDNITPYNRPVSQYMSSAAICVRYLPTGQNNNNNNNNNNNSKDNKAPPPPAPVTNITAPKPLDNNWLDMNNINATEAFRFERESQEFASRLQDEVIAAVQAGKSFVPGVGNVSSGAGYVATNSLVAVVVAFVVALGLMV